MAETVRWQDKLKGAFDLTFLFGRGILPFEKDPSKKAGLQSLWIPILLLPLSFIAEYFWPGEGLEKQTLQTRYLIIAEGAVLNFAGGLALLWVATRAFDRRDRFWITFQAGNWTSIPLTILSLPLLLLAVEQWYPRAQMDHVFNIVTYYGFVVGACVYFRGLKIWWGFGGFLASVAIFIGQNIQNLLFWVNGVPIKWW